MSKQKDKRDKEKRVMKIIIKVKKKIMFKLMKVVKIDFINVSVNLYTQHPSV